MPRYLTKVPIPLMFALVALVGVYTSLVLRIELIDVSAWPVSWDHRYATNNGTHVYQTAPMIGTPMKTLILGYGTATFGNPTDVYYLRKVFRGGQDGDLGGYLPTVLIIESGSLPTNTYIEWNDPRTNRPRKLYFVAGSDRAYVMGPYYWLSDYSAAIIPLTYHVVGQFVFVYPREHATTNIQEMCAVIRNAGFSGTVYNDAYFVLGDASPWDCLYGGYFGSPDIIDWAQVASSATSASLFPDPTHYRVTVNVGNSRITIVVSYWYMVDRDPGFFAVRRP
jgi:hypothetical protein